MKKDHNLDDLIIDDIRKPVKTKNKNLLTLIALVIVVLIVVIVTTRMFLGEEEHNLTTAPDSNTEVMISPDLELDDSGHDEDTDKKELEQLSSMMEESLTDQDNDQDKEITEKTTETPAPVKKEPETVKPETTQVKESPDTGTAAQPATKTYDTPKASTPVIVEKPKPKPKPRPKPKSTPSSGTYFIQVGSFSKSPSKQFLSVIKKSGFHYKLRGGKLLIGPYRSDAAARRDLPRVRNKINKSAFIKHF